MASFIIEGGHRLEGTIVPQGAKNEALEVICATLLTAEEVRITNIPEILDVQHLIGLLRHLGVEVNRLAAGDYTFRADRVDLSYGGDKIGRRRVDTHLSGMQQLGASLDVDADHTRYTLRAERLQGDYMLLDEASVTGTANIVMAAALAKGTTTIYNAACEPYVQQLCRLLNRMGAHIEGVASNLLTIEGVSSLHGAQHVILPDMIEVGSFIGMSAMLGGGLTIQNTSVYNLGNIPRSFQRLGIRLEVHGDDIVVPRQDHYEIEDDAPWPGLTPVLLSGLIVVATQAKGSVLFHQKMFESRLFFVDRLIDMGAQIILCDPHRAVVVGHDQAVRLRARRMVSPDIRAGIALLIAAMSAEGVSRIDNVEQIDRGYEHIDQRLNALGANIKRE